MVVGSSLTVMSGFRFVRRAAKAGVPVVIVNRGATRGDDLATVRLDAGCSEFLTALAASRAGLAAWRGWERRTRHEGAVRRARRRCAPAASRSSSAVSPPEPTRTPASVAVTPTTLSGRAPIRRSVPISGSSFCSSSEIRRTRTLDCCAPARSASSSVPARNSIADEVSPSSDEPGDRVAVRRLRRMVEQVDEAALHGLRHHVLPPAGLGVDELPVEADHVGEEPLGQAVLAHHPGGKSVPLGGQLEVSVALDGHQAVALHARDRLRHRRPGLVKPLRDPGTQRHDALFDQLVDGPEVHLRGVDQVAHWGLTMSL